VLPVQRGAPMQPQVLGHTHVQLAAPVGAHSGDLLQRHRVRYPTRGRGGPNRLLGFGGQVLADDVSEIEVLLTGAHRVSSGRVRSSSRTAVYSTSHRSARVMRCRASGVNTGHPLPWENSWAS